MWKNLFKAQNAKRAAVLAGIGVAGYGVAQGMALRDRYRERPQLQPPRGPPSGFIKFKEEKIDVLISKTKDVVKELKQKIGEIEQLTQLEEKIEDLSAVLQSRVELIKSKVLPSTNSKAKEQEQEQAEHGSGMSVMDRWRQLNRLVWRHGETGTGNEEAPQASKAARKIKLLVLGDSLVAGVGCSNTEESPVLPRVLARVLNKQLRADVAWHSAGIVGGTVSDLRGLLPALKEGGFLGLQHGRGGREKDDEEEEVVCVIICGLNDFKHCIERFGRGPDGFRRELEALVQELGNLGVKKVFVPALPATLLETDPHFSLRVFPLRLVAAFFCSLWDLQKYNLAVEYGERTDRGVEPLTLSFIENPSVYCDYSTPGEGNVSSDGIHPSTQGYRWWGRWLGERVASRMEAEGGGEEEKKEGRA
jgi:lysophospholipase L1-like esterase